MSEFSSDKLNIMLIDDDDVDAKGIERSLKKANINHTFVRAKDGIIALELLQNIELPQPLIILLDLNMPRMGGLEFLDVLRKDEQLSKATVFVLSTSKDQTDISASYEKCISGYIVKESLSNSYNPLIQLMENYAGLVQQYPTGQ